jgi:hypothetical protein
VKVHWSNRVEVRLSPGSQQSVVLEPGEPFEMPDEEALARVAVGNVDPHTPEELMAAQDRIAKRKTAESQPDGMTLESKPEGTVLEAKPTKKAADPVPDKSAPAGDTKP